LHGSSHHVGEAYLSAGPREVDEKQVEISNLRNKLKQAIETENFELAAEIRDQLRTLE
jgi:protein arginine kinase activator